jgi:hypothetical protein
LYLFLLIHSFYRKKVAKTKTEKNGTRKGFSIKFEMNTSTLRHFPWDGGNTFCHSYSLMWQTFGLTTTFPDPSKSLNRASLLSFRVQIEPESPPSSGDTEAIGADLWSSPDSSHSSYSHSTAPSSQPSCSPLLVMSGKGASSSAGMWWRSLPIIHCLQAGRRVRYRESHDYGNVARPGRSSRASLLQSDRQAAVSY